MKRFLACALTAVMSLSLFVGCGANSKSADKRSDDIVILFTNDIHCGINEGMGLSTLATYKDELKEKYQYVVTVDAGDAIEGSALGTISNGEIVIDAMNVVSNYAIMGGTCYADED